MEIKEVIGIDASKLTLDCSIYTKGVQEAFENDPQGIAQMIDWTMDNTTVPREKILFVFEHTGLYTYHLIKCLGQEDCLLRVVPGLEIKRSLGIARGKDDRVDARRIALYGYRTREETVKYKAPDGTLEILKRLSSLRRRLVRQRAGNLSALGEQYRVFGDKDTEILYRAQREVISVLSREITLLDKEIEKLVSGDPGLKKLYKLLTSIKGIGKVTALFLIVYTNGFTIFRTWRKFASYCGIAPFPYRSGTSTRGRTKVSKLANKEGKALLNQCACTAIQHSPEIRAYYQRRVAQGKNKMSTLNIIRNKLLARAFAVVKRGTPYVDTMGYAA